MEKNKNGIREQTVGNGRHWVAQGQPQKEMATLWKSKKEMEIVGSCWNYNSKKDLSNDLWV